MALAPGTRIGSYEIAAQIGAGGMGEVYRARDSRLDRAVAIKVLPDVFAQDTERLARFDREAKTLAALNHPGIAHIYGIEDAAGSKALVMELVEGPTLADRIAQGPIPVDEALAIAKQIAEALEAAHEQGIIHRDLKPANVKVRPDGTVKVLDFGLAKAMGPAGAASASQTMSPTITTPAMTQAGLILGTAAYMAPEQARGRPVDRRADIWAFGCVLYEMLIGRRAFDADDISLTLARVLEREVDVAALPGDVPGRVRQVVSVCLRKDPRQRAGDMHDVRLMLEGAFETLVRDGSTPAGATGPLWRRALPATAAALITALVVGFGAWAMTGTDAGAPTGLLRFEINAPDATFPANAVGSPQLALSPDGRSLVYVGASAEGQQLFLRDLEHLDVRPVPGTSGAGTSTPFFSPDGLWLGFFTTVANVPTIRKVALAGGPPQTIVNATPRGAAWGPDDTIVFGVLEAGLSQVSADGGEVEILTTLEADEVDHRRPEVLPNGRGVLFTIWTGSLDTAQIAVVDRDTRERRTLIGGTRPRYAATGHLVFARAASLWAAPFDADRLELTGPAVPVVEGVDVPPGSGAAQFALGREGTLVYVPGGTEGGSATGARRLVWADREGAPEFIAAEPRNYQDPAVSPDGQQVALSIVDTGNTDVWTWHLERETLTRLTFDEAIEDTPLWTPDGSRMVFRSTRDGGGLYSKAADGTGPEEPLATGGNWFPLGWAADGQLVVMEQSADGFDIGMLDLGSDERPQPVLHEAYNEGRLAMSPDGRWIAYESDESGQVQIYVRPFPDVNRGRWQVSSGGGTDPLWSPDGTELMFTIGGTGQGSLMVVDVSTTETFSHTAPTELFNYLGYTMPPSAHRRFHVSPDGRRLLMLTPTGGGSADTPEGEVPELVLVQHWFDELKRLVPRN